MKEEPDKEEKKEEEPPKKPPLPPLEKAAKRLERLLSEKALDFYTSPSKIVRRWLTNASAVSGGATAEDIRSASQRLLDPSQCPGRALLSSSESMEEDGAGTNYLTTASAREIESWLISLAVRILWKEKKYEEALQLAQKGIDIILGIIDASASSPGSASSLFPLLSRLYRWRSLIVESAKNPALDAQLMADMAKAHNLATLRRDVDTQATLLNCMLRNLLHYSQGKIH